MKALKIHKNGFSVDTPSHRTHTSKRIHHFSIQLWNDYRSNIEFFSRFCAYLRTIFIIIIEVAVVVSVFCATWHIVCHFHVQQNVLSVSYGACRIRYAPSQIVVRRVRPKWEMDERKREKRKKKKEKKSLITGIQCVLYIFNHLLITSPSKYQFTDSQKGVH